MGKETGIEWTDHTFNPWWGCTKVSPGCANCYAERDSNRYGNDLWGPGKARRTFSDKHWAEPLKWNAAARAEGRRHRVFCASMADVFEEEAPAAELRRLWALIWSTPHLDWQLLTKRPHLIASKLPADWGDGWANVWLGTSVEDQKRAEERIPHLLNVPAHVRFLSCEPLLGPLALRPWDDFSDRGHGRRWLGGPSQNAARSSGIDWVIVGGESGPAARPMHPDWVRSLRDQCKDACAAFFFKQWGEWSPVPAAGVSVMGCTDDGFHNGDNPECGAAMYRVGKRAAGRLLDGVTHDGMPS